METYTFSRALHLMRYGGKKMKCLGWSDGVFAYVKDGKFFIQEEDTGAKPNSLSDYEIMGSWVEVKE